MAKQVAKLPRGVNFLDTYRSPGIGAMIGIAQSGWCFVMFGD